MGSFYPVSAPVLPDAFWKELAEINPICSEKITEQDAMDWFYLRAFPRYRAYGYTDHERVITLWWARIDGQEILDARHLRAVKEGKAKPKRYSTRRGSKEMPQEHRQPALQGLGMKESSLSAILRVVK